MYLVTSSLWLRRLSIIPNLVWALVILKLYPSGSFLNLCLFPPIHSSLTRVKGNTSASPQVCSAHPHSLCITVYISFFSSFSPFPPCLSPFTTPSPTILFLLWEKKKLSELLLGHKNFRSLGFPEVWFLFLKLSIISDRFVYLKGLSIPTL
jgi:hypothetical protein